MDIIKTANATGKYFDKNSRYKVINYVLNSHKMIHDYYDGAMVNMDSVDSVVESMNEVDARYNKEDGVKLRHFILSFSKYELNDPCMANLMAIEVMQYLANMCQTIYAVHEEKEYIHIHIVINFISYVDGRRYYGTRAEFHAFRSYIQNVLKGYGIRSLKYVSNK